MIGEPGTAEEVISHLAARTDHPYVVVGVVPVGQGSLGSGAPVAARLEAQMPPVPGGDAEAVLGAVRSHHADLVLVAPGARMAGSGCAGSPGPCTTPASNWPCSPGWWKYPSSGWRR